MGDIWISKDRSLISETIFISISVVDVLKNLDSFGYGSRYRDIRAKSEKRIAEGAEPCMVAAGLVERDDSYC